MKKTSALRRIPTFDECHCVSIRGREGAVCVFELSIDARTIVVESVCSRRMILAPGDMFLGTTGYRESTRWVVGGVPGGGLIPGRSYRVLAECGVVGDFRGESPLQKDHLGEVTYVGSISTRDGQAVNIDQFAAGADAPVVDRRAPVFLFVGTSAEVGKTTAASVVLRSLRMKGARSITALKATGTSSLAELMIYKDFGANHVFDCVDFGLPTTYPSGRKGMEAFFSRALDTCLSIPSDGVVIECGGDLLGGNVPVFLRCLKLRRPDARVVLAAADAFGASCAKRMLEEETGLAVTMVTGPCTDTPTLLSRTQTMCGIPAVNMTGTRNKELAL